MERDTEDTSMERYSTLADVIANIGLVTSIVIMIIACEIVIAGS